MIMWTSTEVPKNAVDLHLNLFVTLSVKASQSHPCVDLVSASSDKAFKFEMNEDDFPALLSPEKQNEDERIERSQDKESLTQLRFPDMKCDLGNPSSPTSSDDSLAESSLPDPNCLCR